MTEDAKPAYLADGRKLLEAGFSIAIAKNDTRLDTIRLHPDGREELVRVDWDEARRLLG